MSTRTYHDWSSVPAPRPAAGRIVARLAEPAAAQSGARTGRGAQALPPRLARLVENARLGRIRPVFDTSQGAVAGRVRGVRVEHRLTPRAARLVSIDVPAGEHAGRLARHLGTLTDEVVYAYVPPPRRPFLARRTAASGPDPLLARQWGHAAVRLPDARAATGFDDGRAVTVAVLDSGVDRTHPDLKGIVVESKNFVRGEGTRDLVGHGTHVAGIIAARANNGLGIAGLCAARILSLKVLPGEAEWDAEGYYRALAYCIGRAAVINLSFGDERSDPGERDVIADVIAGGVVVVAAMGNEHDRGNPVQYPAALPGVCAVGATDHADRRWVRSNTGPHLSVCAPGVAVLSTTPTYAYPHGSRDYDDFDGTSMAAPHVTAAVALLRARRPQLTPAQVVDRIRRHASRVPGMKKKRPDPNVGWGRLDVAATLR